MTTGVIALGADLMETGVDLLYYVDPVQDRVDLAAARRLFKGRMALAGGVNSAVTLARGDKAAIAAAVSRAMEVFGRENGGFILSPLDALFPDTPWQSVEAMIQTWRATTA
jgi:uroporphyrinogen-III decarboxylase